MDFEPISSELLARARGIVERKRRKRIVTMIIPGLIGVLIFVLVSNTPVFYGDGLLNQVLGLSAAVLIGASAAMWVINYLQTGFALSNEQDLAQALLSLGVNESVIFNADFTQSSEFPVLKPESSLVANSIGLDEGAKQRLVEDLKNHIAQSSADDLSQRLYAETSARLTNNLKLNQIHESFQVSRKRLLDEIESLGKKGNINLGLGVGITVVGLLLLGITVINEIDESQDVIKMASHFLPRLSLVVLIEVFAYFFLRLYKAGLAEIKYFQNELTNLECKQIAVRAAFEAADNPVVASVVAKLSETERNHIISKDQTTVELEKAKIESESNVAFGKFVTDFVQKVKPAS